eukprot:gb/GECH01012087.1/.p1 GENE.gb/GECH01012087.1/~~gb/GECH01012087.1/.p1  ORF type:complete len:190 (+),score=24.72 gb/GECH01012087.1/:1-570(+)
MEHSQEILSPWGIQVRIWTLIHTMLGLLGMVVFIVFSLAMPLYLFNVVLSIIIFIGSYVGAIGSYQHDPKKIKIYIWALVGSIGFNLFATLVTIIIVSVTEAKHHVKAGGIVLSVFVLLGFFVGHVVVFGATAFCGWKHANEIEGGNLSDSRNDGMASAPPASVPSTSDSQPPIEDQQPQEPAQGYQTY